MKMKLKKDPLRKTMKTGKNNFEKNRIKKNQRTMYDSSDTILNFDVE